MSTRVWYDSCVWWQSVIVSVCVPLQRARSTNVTCEFIEFGIMMSHQTNSHVTFSMIFMSHVTRRKHENSISLSFGFQTIHTSWKCTWSYISNINVILTCIDTGTYGFWMCEMWIFEAVQVSRMLFCSVKN